MSGCQPTDCQCRCHSTGIRHMFASNPPQPCCGCSELSKFNGFGMSVHDRILNVERDNNELRQKIQTIEVCLQEMKDGNKLSPAETERRAREKALSMLAVSNKSNTYHG
jgi:hypothetical protein